MAPSMAEAAIRGGSTADKHKERLFSELLRDRSLDEVRAISRAYAAEHVAGQLRTKTKARLDWHVASGHHVVIVSASPALYVEPMGVMLGVRGVVAQHDAHRLAAALALDAHLRGGGRWGGARAGGTARVLWEGR